MPSRLIRSAEAPVMSAPSKLTWPDCARTRPETARATLLLPGRGVRVLEAQVADAEEVAARPRAGYRPPARRRLGDSRGDHPESGVRGAAGVRGHVAKIGGADRRVALYLGRGTR